MTFSKASWTASRICFPANNGNGAVQKLKCLFELCTYRPTLSLRGADRRWGNLPGPGATFNAPPGDSHGASPLGMTWLSFQSSSQPTNYQSGSVLIDRGHYRFLSVVYAMNHNAFLYSPVLLIKAPFRFKDARFLPSQGTS